MGELLVIDLRTFWVDGVSNAAFRFDEPLVVTGRGVLGTKASSLHGFSTLSFGSTLDYSHAEDIPGIPSISRGGM